MRKPADSWRPQLARRTTAAHRRREASCRCSASSSYKGRPQPALHGARAAASSRAAPPPERQRAPARVGLLHTRQKAWRWRPQLARPTAVARRRREASRLCSLLVWRINDHNQRGTARAQRQQARVLRLLPRDSERSGALMRAPRKPADYWRLQLARRTTATHRRIEASCRCSASSSYISRPQPALHGARAQKACVLRLLLRDSQRSGALAHATQNRLILGVFS